MRKTQKDRNRVKRVRKDKKDKSIKRKNNQKYVYKKDGYVYYLEKVDTTDREEWERHIR